MISLFFSPFLPFSPLLPKLVNQPLTCVPQSPSSRGCRSFDRSAVPSCTAVASAPTSRERIACWLNFCEQTKNHHFLWKSIRAFLSFPVSLRILFAGGGQLLPMRCFVGTFAAALGFVAAVGAFHTPYRPEQSRHYDVTKTNSFHPITEKVFVHLPPPQGNCVCLSRAYLSRRNYLADYPFYCWCD